MNSGVNSKVKSIDYIDYKESISVKVGIFLSKKGFNIADCSGLASNSLVKTNELGILWKDPDTKPRKYLFGLISVKPRRIFVGVVWFDNGNRNATEQHWVFEVYGRKYVKLARQLADEMASTFKINITLSLVCEEPVAENYMSDYGLS